MTVETKLTMALLIWTRRSYQQNHRVDMAAQTEYCKF